MLPSSSGVPFSVFQRLSQDASAFVGIQKGVLLEHHSEHFPTASGRKAPLVRLSSDG